MHNATLIVTALALGLALFAAPTHAAKKEKKEDAGSDYPLAFKLKSIQGKEVDFAKQYQGKALVIVNVASQCGYTKHYKGLQELHEKYHKQGLAVIGVPCNQFGKQEPGSDLEIKQFCESKFGVEFDMFSKVDVNGENATPLYKHLKSEKATPDMPGDVKWNFEKFVVNADGEVVERFRSRTAPMSEEMIEAVEAALKTVKKDQKKDKKEKAG